jgi:hypothetical protein
LKDQTARREIDGQPRLMSLVESIANVVAGFGLAVLTQLAVLPWFDVRLSMVENLIVGAIFTLVSIVRSYTLRRLFETLRTGRAP